MSLLTANRWATASEVIVFSQEEHGIDDYSAAGPMAEAMENSLQYLTSEDISALVAYLRTDSCCAAPRKRISATPPQRVAPAIG
jgi:hypothetical protein